jgi:hypothetical protein
MDPRKLIRDKDRLLGCVKELPNNTLVALRDLKIQCPQRFAGHNLAKIDVETRVAGIFATIIDDTYYAVSLVNAMIQLTPTETSRLTIDGVGYFEFFFSKGSTIIPNLNLVKQDTLVYNIFDEFLATGHVPWYLNYFDLGKILGTSKKYAGTNLGENQEVVELIVSMISRDRKDRTKYYRASIQSLSDIEKNPPVFVPLQSVQYGATNTTNKIAGAYFSDGLTSALIDPAERVERIEGILTQ